MGFSHGSQRQPRAHGQAYDDSGNDATSSAVTVTVSNTSSSDTTKPTVSITAPTNGSDITFSDGVEIDNLQVSATDNVAVTKVEAYDGTRLIGTDTAAPYNFTWTSGIAGTHSLTAKAYDAAGNSTTSGVVSVNVVVDQSPGGSAGDVNGDSRVNALDLSALITHDGQNYPAADFSHDGTVGAADMAILLSKWTW